MRRAIAVFLMVSLIGCSTWKPLSREQLVSIVAKRTPSRVRVIQIDSVLEVRHPTLRSDTLFGVAESPAYGAIAVPLADIESGAIRKGNRTAAGFVAGFALLMTYMILTPRSYTHP